MLSSLRLPGFRWVAAIYSLDYVVELASSVALMVLVYDATDSPIAAAAMLTCKQVLPGVVGASLGRYLERVTIRHGLAVAYLLTAATLAILGALGHGPLLYVLAIVAGTCGTAVRTLLRTAVARSTTGQIRRSANALLNVIMGVVALVGPAIGAFLVSTASIPAALAILAVVSATLSVASLAMPAVVGQARVSADLPDEDEAIADDRDAPAAPHPRVSTAGLLILGGVVWGLFAMDEPALLAYAQDALYSGVAGYGAILTAWGAGMVLGSAFYGQLLRSSMPIVFAAGAAVAAGGYVGLGLAPTITLACIASLVGGGGNGVLWVALVTAVQENTPDDRQAAVAARLEGICTATPAIGVIVGGVVAEVVAARASLLIPGVLALVAIGVWLFSERQALRRPLELPLVRTPIHSDVSA